MLSGRKALCQTMISLTGSTRASSRNHSGHLYMMAPSHSPCLWLPHFVSNLAPKAFWGTIPARSRRFHPWRLSWVLGDLAERWSLLERCEASPDPPQRSCAALPGPKPLQLLLSFSKAGCSHPKAASSLTSSILHADNSSNERLCAAFQEDDVC